MSFIVGFSRNARGSILGSSLLNYNVSLQQRHISVSASLLGKRNVRKFFLGNKRGTKLFRRDQALGKYDDIAPIYTEVKPAGYLYDGLFHKVPEMIPEIVVPDLTDCQLKPYVSYRTADIYQSEFTAQDLFDVVYRKKIMKDFEENKLDEDGNPLEPTEMEQLTSDEAWIQSRKSGSDIFSERIPKLWECLDKQIIDEPVPQIQVNSDDIKHPSENKKKLQSSESEAPPIPKLAAIKSN